MRTAGVFIGLWWGDVVIIASMVKRDGEKEGWLKGNEPCRGLGAFIETFGWKGEVWDFNASSQEHLAVDVLKSA